MFVHAGFEAEQDLRILLGRNEVPHLGLSASTGVAYMDRRVGIVGMLLQGKHVRRKYEFNEERKFVAVGELRAAPFAGHFPPCVTQRLAAKFRSCDAAVETGEPRFAQRLR